MLKKKGKRWSRQLSVAHYDRLAPEQKAKFEGEAGKVNALIAYNKA